MFTTFRQTKTVALLHTQTHFPLEAQISNPFHANRSIVPVSGDEEREKESN